MAKNIKQSSKALATAAAVGNDKQTSFEIVKALCEKALGHGLVATEDEVDEIHGALDELEGLQQS